MVTVLKSSVIRAYDQCPSKMINQLIIPKNNAVDQAI